MPFNMLWRWIKVERARLWRFIYDINIRDQTRQDLLVFSALHKLGKKFNRIMLTRAFGNSQALEPTQTMDSSSPASTRRAVDLLPPNPTAQSDYRPTEVLALGLSRTATMSMHAALTKLGHKTYHFMEVGQRDLVVEGKPREDHIACWTEAFEAKIYDGGRIEYGKEQFDKLLRRYSAVTDAPCACFSDELLEAYPQAKVILTNRDPMKWLASMETAYYRILESEDWKWFRALADLDFVSCDFVSEARLTSR